MKIFNLIITTKARQKNRDKACFAMGFDKGKEFSEKDIFSVINPVISDLERLRANTWDQDKITKIEIWLKDNFNIK